MIASFRQSISNYLYNPYWLGSERAVDKFDIDIVHIKMLLMIIAVQGCLFLQWPQQEALMAGARYIYTDSHGVPLKPSPLHEPLPKKDVLDFGKKALERGFTVHQGNFRNRIFNATNRYFELRWSDVEGTEGGQFQSVRLSGIRQLEGKRVYPGQELMVLIYKAGIFSAIIEENAAFVADIVEGEIVAEGEFDMGSYQQYQYLVKYKANLYRYDDQKPPARRLPVEFIVKIVRVGTSASNDLLLIERVQMAVGEKRV